MTWIAGSDKAISPVCVCVHRLHTIAFVVEIFDTLVHSGLIKGQGCGGQSLWSRDKNVSLLC